MPVRLLVLLLFTCCALPLWALNTETYVTAKAEPVTADLNGDGKEEAIYAMQLPLEQPNHTDTMYKGDPFLLIIGKTAYIGDLYAKVRYQVSFTIVDIDPRDKQREVLIDTTKGEGHYYQFFRFDGKRVYPVGRLQARSIVLPGDGVVHVRRKQNPFPALADTYTLNAKTHRLQQRKATRITLNAQTINARPVRLSRTRSRFAASTELPADSPVEFVRYEKGWFLLKTSSGTEGWVPERAVTQDNFPQLKWTDEKVDNLSRTDSTDLSTVTMQVQVNNPAYPTAINGQPQYSHTVVKATVTTD